MERLDFLFIGESREDGNILQAHRKAGLSTKIGWNVVAIDDVTNLIKKSYPLEVDQLNDEDKKVALVDAKQAFGIEG